MPYLDVDVQKNASIHPSNAMGAKTSTAPLRRTARVHRCHRASAQRAQGLRESGRPGRRFRSRWFSGAAVSLGIDDRHRAIAQRPSIREPSVRPAKTCLTALLPGGEPVEVSLEPYPDDAGVSPILRGIRPLPRRKHTAETRNFPPRMASPGPGGLKALPASERVNPAPRIRIRPFRRRERQSSPRTEARSEQSWTLGVRAGRQNPGTIGKRAKWSVESVTEASCIPCTRHGHRVHPNR